MFFGLFLILIGVLVLLRTLGIITGSVWGFVWAGLLISLGLSIIWGRHRWMQWRSRWWHEHDDVMKQ